jgi:hypothetical protein
MTIKSFLYLLALLDRYLALAKSPKVLTPGQVIATNNVIQTIGQLIDQQLHGRRYKRVTAAQGNA